MLRKVEPGQDVVRSGAMSAEFVNKTIDLIHSPSRQSGSSPVDTDDDLVDVLNASGSDIGNRFGILAIDDLIVTPTDNQSEFENNWGFKGVTPDESNAEHRGNFIVTDGPIANGAIGRGRAFGITPVTIDVTNEDHIFADITDSDTTMLTSGVTGARIKWKESGTGQKKALVMLGAISTDGGTFFKTPAGGIPRATDELHPGSAACVRYRIVNGVLTAAETDTVLCHVESKDIPGDLMIQAKTIDGNWVIDVQPCPPEAA